MCGISKTMATTERLQTTLTLTLDKNNNSFMAVYTSHFLFSHNQDNIISLSILSIKGIKIPSKHSKPKILVKTQTLKH